MTSSMDTILKNPSKEYINAMLSNLAYEDLKIGRITSLSSTKFSSAEIKYLENNFEIIASHSNTNTGFYGYLIKNIQADEYIYAIRGTDDFWGNGNDLLPDSEIITKGMAIDQFIDAYNYYQDVTGGGIHIVNSSSEPNNAAYIDREITYTNPDSLTTSTIHIYYYLKETSGNQIISPDKLTITGHSLGGHLAGLLGIITGKETTIFNAPGYKTNISDRDTFTYCDEENTNQKSAVESFILNLLNCKTLSETSITHIYNANGNETVANYGKKWDNCEKIYCLQKDKSAHSINEICTSYYAYETIKDIVTGSNSFYHESNLTSFQETFENVYKAYCAYFNVNYQNLDYSNYNFINNLISSIAIWKSNIEANGGTIKTDSFNHSTSIPINGNNGADIIYTGGGNDTVDAKEGDDVVYGYDYYNPEAPSNYTKNINLGSGSDTYYGGEGNDIVDGGSGVDSSNNTNTINLGNGNNEYHGGAGNDNITGGNGIDIIYAGDGVNIIDGGSGNNEMHGGNAFNSFRSGSDNDTVWSYNTTDSISLGAGNNTIYLEDNKSVEWEGRGRIYVSATRGTVDT